MDPPLPDGPTTGKTGQASFVLEFGDPTRAIAVRASAALYVATRTSASRIAAMTTDDPAIVAVVDLDRSHAQDGRVTATLHAAATGDTDVVVRDASGTEIDRTTLHVRPTDTLRVGHTWGPGDALVLANTVERLHVTTVTAGVVTAGTGAVQFTLTGALSAAAPGDAPWFPNEGDDIVFRAGAGGSGTVTAEAPDTELALPISIVAPEAVTRVIVSPTTLHVVVDEIGYVAIGAAVGDVPVFGAHCTWSNAAGLRIDADENLDDALAGLDRTTGWLGVDPSFTYRVRGAAGTYTPTCTLASGVTTTVTVIVR